MTKYKTNPGFLLVEAIMAITILIMVSATSISLLVMGFRAINMNKHSLEASWLAQEGAESLRGLRNTNWLRFGYDKKNCWTIATSNKCSSTSKISGTKSAPAIYSLGVSLSKPPILTVEKNQIDLSKGENASENKSFLLYYQDIDPTTDYDGDGKKDNDKQYIGPKNATYTTVEATKYYRQIETYVFNPNQVEATITVGWYEGSTPHAVKLPVTLTNYQLEE